jgi:hypothetical protein
MEVALNFDPDPTMFLWLDPDLTTFLWLPDFSNALPSPILIENEEAPPYSAHTARLVKLRSAPTPNHTMAGQLPDQTSSEHLALTTRRGFLLNAFRHLAPSRQTSYVRDQTRYQAYFRTRDMASCSHLPPNFLIRDLTTTRSSGTQHCFLPLPTRRARALLRTFLTRIPWFSDSFPMLNHRRCRHQRK